MIRGRVTALLGIALTVLEGISGLALMVTALPGAGSLARASGVGIVTAVLVATSSAVHLMKVRDRSRAREASEGKRLYVALKHPMGDSPSVIEGEPAGPDPSTDLGDGRDPR